MHVRQRAKVYDAWGFGAARARGLGISALFAGPSGTGKTMAGEVLANELNLDLYRIDLSQVVNKYIGETEKNLRRVFDAAEEGGAILLFDEADALFGKRSEVKDSHDRYANIEISYLLQRMEAYRGLAILTTNMKSALDTAFLRRLRFVVQFPFPDAAQRAEIWRRVFPAPTPTEGLDFAQLARLQVAGGNIRNMALNAAFLAAEAGPAGGHGPSAARRQERIRQARTAARRSRDRRMAMNHREQMRRRRGAGVPGDDSSTGTAAMKPPASVELRIERLVLDGVAPGDRYDIADAVRSELARLLAQQSVPPANRNPAD